MQKRIDYLMEKVKSANDAMKEAQTINDYFKYPEAVKAYNVYATERTWLEGVQSLIKPKIERDSYEMTPHHEVAIRLTFAPVDIPTPFNKILYDIGDKFAPKMDIIHVESLKYQFVYSLRLDKFSPAKMVAEQINISWLRADRFLDGFVRGVDLANMGLAHIKTLLDYAHGDDLALRGAIYYLQNRYNSDRIRGVMDADTYFDYLKGAAGRDWEVTERLILFYLERDVFQIDWQPFQS